MRDLMTLVESLTLQWQSILTLDEPAKTNALKAFDHLAYEQRGEPEMVGGAGPLTANPGIHHASGIYTNLTEHIGDLTNRMAKGFHVTSLRCGYGYVKNKTVNALRTLRHGYGCEREIKEQIASNHRFYTERGNYSGTMKQWVDEFHAGARRYAEAHEKLVVYNEAQWHAREAAVALGYEKFDVTTMYLRALEEHLGDPETWAAYASLVRIGANDQPIPYDR